MTLKALSPAQTEFAVETGLTILGKIGEFGQPIIRKKADDMMQQFDQSQQARYATEDQQLAADPLAGTPGHASQQATQFNRMQDANAVGPQGYNRQQVPFIQDVSGKTVTGLRGPQDAAVDPQEGPFGPFGAGTGGNMPNALPPMAGLNMALAGKNLRWSGR